jgi:hypothetical protein
LVAAGYAAVTTISKLIATSDSQGESVETFLILSLLSQLQVWPPTLPVSLSAPHGTFAPLLVAIPPIAHLASSLPSRRMACRSDPACGAVVDRNCAPTS